MVWDPAGTAQVLDADGQVVTPGTRVRSVVLNDGTEIIEDGAIAPDAPALNVATIDFLARGGDEYPFRSAPFVTLGVTYQQALRHYIVLALDGVITAAQYPEGGEGRIKMVEQEAGATIRFATFNASLNRNAEGQLIADLSTPDNAQAKAVAEIIQRTHPDVLLINEFDFDADGRAVDLFQRNMSRSCDGFAMKRGQQTRPALFERSQRWTSFVATSDVPRCSARM
jgi:hypothetical protein